MRSLKRMGLRRPQPWRGGAVVLAGVVASASMAAAMPRRIVIGEHVSRRNVERFGTNLSGQSFYDSGSMVRNLVARNLVAHNPDVQGETWPSIVCCERLTRTTCTTDFRSAVVAAPCELHAGILGFMAQREQFNRTGGQMAQRMAAAGAAGSKLAVSKVRLGTLNGSLAITQAVLDRTIPTMDRALANKLSVNVLPRTVVLSRFDAAAERLLTRFSLTTYTWTMP